MILTMSLEVVVVGRRRRGPHTSRGGATRTSGGRRRSSRGRATP